MGIIRKAAIGSMLVGLGAVALVKNKKPLEKIRKSVTKNVANEAKEVRKILSNGFKKSHRSSVSKKHKTAKHR